MAAEAGGRQAGDLPPGSERLIGGLAAEELRHPGSAILRPRRELVRRLIERVFAGADTGPAWRRQAFDTWWSAVSTQEEQP